MDEHIWTTDERSPSARICRSCATTGYGSPPEIRVGEDDTGLGLYEAPARECTGERLDVPHPYRTWLPAELEVVAERLRRDWLDKVKAMVVDLYRRRQAETGSWTSAMSFEEASAYFTEHRDASARCPTKENVRVAFDALQAEGYFDHE